MDREIIVDAISEWLGENHSCTTVKTCDECASRELELYENQIRIKVLEEVKSKMISFHTDAIFQYGTDIIEARADAFNELKDWLKEECNE